MTNLPLGKRGVRDFEGDVRTGEFANCYQDGERAEAYSTLEFARTYYLAYRDLPEIFSQYAKSTAAIDFGCGAGRSTRFLRKCGFQAIGVDISKQMIAKAREVDPGGDYRVIKNGDFSGLKAGAYALVLSAFTFDNIASSRKLALFRGLGELLKSDGCIVNVVSAPEIYVNEWASFSTKEFPENRHARSGDVVRIITTDHPDHRPVEDILCTDAAYRRIYRNAGLHAVATYRPLATGDEPYEWVNETRIAAWVVYVLQKTGKNTRTP